MAALDLLSLVDGLAPNVGMNETAWPGLVCFRATRPSALSAMIYTPVLVVVAQGAKIATVGTQVFRSDPHHYLVAGTPLPAHARIVRASTAQPFLSMMLSLETGAVRDVLAELPGELQPGLGGSDAIGMRTEVIDARLLRAVGRFLEAVTDPVERRIVAPGFLREIVLLLLRGGAADLVATAARTRQPAGVLRAIQHARRHAFRAVDVATLARAAAMSPSALHAAFREATATTPLQYVKRLRLERARELIVDDGVAASDAAHRVGYESPSQFTREFKRLFGLPPAEYARSSRAHAR